MKLHARLVLAALLGASLLGVVRAQSAATLAALPLSFAPDPTATRFRAQTTQSAVEINARGFTTFARSAHRTTALNFSFRDANDTFALRGEEALPGRVNFLGGADPALHRTNVETFSRVRASAVYPGIDVVWRGSGREIEYDLHVAPGVDPRQISLRVAGAEKIELDADSGALRFHTADGVLEKKAPVLYQDIDGERREVTGRFVLRGDDAFAFEVGDYNPEHELVIDPLLIFGSFLGGSGADVGRGIAVNAAGEIFVAGITDSANFPATSGSLQPAIRGTFNQDLFVAKFNAAGTALVYCTYLGSTTSETFGAFAVDSAGSAYLAGSGDPVSLPRVATSYTNPLDTGFGMFVAKLAPNGASLVYNVILGVGQINGMMVDAGFNVTIVGTTGSANFPTTPGAYNRSPDVSLGQAFVAKINGGGTALLFSTFIGTTLNFDTATGVAQDATGSYYVCGTTSGPSFPSTTGAYQTAVAGGTDAFVVKLSADGGTLNWASLLGGRTNDSAVAIAVDSQGRPVVLGNTNGTSPSFGVFPVTPGTLYTPNSLASFSKVFVTCFAANGASLVFSTMFNNNGSELASPSLSLDANNNVTFAGTTQSTSANFPVTDTTTFTANGGNGGTTFIARLNATGTAVLYSTRLTESSAQNAVTPAVTTDAGGAIYLAGSILSTNFYTTPGAYRTTAPGGGDAVFLKLDPSASPAPIPTITAQPAAQTVASGTTVTLSVTATGATSYQWQRNGVAVAGATSATLTLANVQAANAGTYTCVVGSSGGSVTSAAAVLTVVAAADLGRIANVSVRTTLAANQLLIVGINMAGGPKPVLIRAAGPSLGALGVPGTMADPRLALFSGTTQIDANDNWGGNAAVVAAISATGSFPLISPTSLDAALLATVDGGRTVQVSGPAAGNLIVEIYDAGTGSTPRLTGISARNQVGTGNNLLIAGFTIAGLTPKTVLIRAVGPTLAAAPFNLPGTLADPKLEIFNSAQVKIGENDTYAPALATTFAALGNFALLPGSKDAATVVTLAPGSYTVVVSGSDGGTGDAIVEVYEVP